ncbi:TRAP transporter substrate-binding protein [Allopusillimonas ginsengisoli]|uniref:TRAP transporter substrate-binding protein n=1 Tax=Allopusillimonas ginsengisoli TaxID=453575 RepID=UPI0010202EC3|nr:TRAP transporter substrate-binding protein [Allopusillimonas ginsengisoli]TEA77032.1 ABC transporter substrate-binding protein [Allopusillimonas ginsengisoli]
MLSLTKWAALAALAFPLAVSATTWTMATGYPENSFFTKNIRQFAQEVEQESAGRLKLDIRANSTLIKHDAIKRAVQSGQVQAGEIRFGVYGNENPVYNLDGLPNIAANYKEAMLLADAQAPFFDKLFGKNGMRVISYVAWPGQGFYTKKEIKSVDDFKGMKLRIYSKPTQKMGEMLGFDAIILPFAEVAQAFATGLIDSQFTSAQTGIDTQAWDNVKYFMYSGTLHNKNGIIINERAFRKLDDDVQKIVLEAGKRATQRGFEMSKQASDETLESLKKHGMHVSQAPQDVQDALAKIGETMMDDWRNTANPEEQKVLDDYLAMKKKAEDA